MPAGPGPSGEILFQGEDVLSRLVLSGGEQSRLRLCMLMDEKVNFLILDEPPTIWTWTPGSGSRSGGEFSGTLLFVSHDGTSLTVMPTGFGPWKGENPDFGGITRLSGLSGAAKALTPPPRKRRKQKGETQTVAGAPNS